jgi:hypothetical protein
MSALRPIVDFMSGVRFGLHVSMSAFDLARPPGLGEEVFEAVEVARVQAALDATLDLLMVFQKAPIRFMTLLRRRLSSRLNSAANLSMSVVAEENILQPDQHARFQFVDTDPARL